MHLQWVAGISRTGANAAEDLPTSFNPRQSATSADNPLDGGQILALDKLPAS